MPDEHDLDRLVLISSTKNDSFARRISDYLDKPLAKTERRGFKDGDLMLRIAESETVRDRDVYLIMTPSQKVSLAERFQELIIWTDTLVSGSAKKLTFVIPTMMGARQDRKTRRAEPINVRAYMGALEGVARNRQGRLGWMTVDLHSPQSQALSMEFDPFSSDPLFVAHARTNYKLDENTVTAAADTGGVKRAEPLARALEINYAGSVSMVRDTTSGAKKEYGFSGTDLDKKTVFLREDMIDGGGTLVTANEVLRRAGARDVVVYATHLLLNNPALERLKSLDVKVIGTDTFYHSPEVLEEAGIDILPVSYLVAEAIKRKYLGQTTRDLHGDNAARIFQERHESSGKIHKALAHLFEKTD